MLIMMRLKGIRKRQLNLLKELETKIFEFNKLNEDLLLDYYECSFINKFLLRMNVKFIYDHNFFCGYIWVSSLDKSTYFIRSFYITEEYRNKFNKEVFKELLDRYGVNNVIYTTSGEEGIVKFMNKLEFFSYSKSIELWYNVKSFNYIFEENIEEFIENHHESIRCDIQNKVFHNENRTPLTLKDIYIEEEQDYYIYGGGIFVKEGDKYIGYGQIIQENSIGIIVNVGVLKEYRKKSYGKTLIKALLAKGKSLGFEKIKIKTSLDNYIALNLYKSLGFTEEGEIIIWNYNRG